MRVTPLEIRQKSFERKLRGYDTQEVDAFLQSLSHEWERLMDDMRDQKLKLEQTERDLFKLKEVENSLYKTLKAAEETGANLLEQARTEAKSIQRQAQIEADTMRNDAERQARIRLEEADESAKNAVFNSQSQLNALITEIRRLESHKENFVLELRNFASSILESLNKESAVVQKLEVKLPMEVYTPVEEKNTDVVFAPKEEKPIPVPIEPKKIVTEQKVLTFFDQIQDI